LMISSLRRVWAEHGVFAKKKELKEVLVEEELP